MAEHLTRHWYVVQVHPKHEFRVASRLEKWGIEVFLPQHRPLGEGGISAGRKEALFPGYVFCRLSLPTNPKLYHVPGVIRLLGPSKRPTPVEDDEVVRLQTITSRPSPMKLGTTNYTKVGIVVSIRDGPFAGLSGLLHPTATCCEFTICFPSLQSTITLSVPFEWVALTDLAAPSLANERGS